MAFEPPDPDQTYRNYLRTCEMLGVKPVSRERAFGLIQEWTEVLSGRPEPTTQLAWRRHRHVGHTRVVRPPDSLRRTHRIADRSRRMIGRRSTGRARPCGRRNFLHKPRATATRSEWFRTKSKGCQSGVKRACVSHRLYACSFATLGTHVGSPFTLVSDQHKSRPRQIRLGGHVMIRLNRFIPFIVAMTSATAAGHLGCDSDSRNLGG